METSKRKKGDKKRPSIQKPEGKKPSLQSYALEPEWFAGLLLPLKQPTTAPAPRFVLSPPVAPMPQPQKPLGELLVELGWEVFKHFWKQTAPISYEAHRAMIALAPHWPSENRWMLGAGAVGTAIYGFGQVSDRFDKAGERQRSRS